MLLSAIDRIKLNGGVPKHLELSIEEGAAFMDTIQEDANRPMSVAVIFPWSSVPTFRRGTHILFGGQLSTLDGPLLGTVKVALVDLVNGALLIRVLDQKPPQERRSRALVTPKSLPFLESMSDKTLGEFCA